MPKIKNPALNTHFCHGMIVGILAGSIVKQTVSDASIETIVKWVQPVGQIFLRMIFMTVIPLILSALVLGIAEIGDLKRVGRIGLRLLAYSLIVSSISVFIGITMVDTFKPGAGLSPETRNYLTEEFLEDSQTAARNAEYAQERTVADVLTNVVPKNPLDDMTRRSEERRVGKEGVSTCK